MRKINIGQYARFMQAMENFTKELDILEQREMADELVLLGSELSEAYRSYRFSLKQFEKSTHRFEAAFETAFARYRLAIRQKRETLSEKHRIAKPSIKNKNAKIKKEGA